MGTVARVGPLCVLQADGQPASGAPPPELPLARMLDMLSEATTLQLDAQEAESGNTALHFAMAYDSEGTLAEYLIQQGADDTIENAVGCTCYDGLGQ